MAIQGINQLHGAQSLSGPNFRRSAPPAEAASPARATDQIDISPEAAEAARIAEAVETRSAEQVRDADGVRTGLVSRLRDEIAAGTYDSPDKVDAALDRLLDEIG